MLVSRMVADIKGEAVRGGLPNLTLMRKQVDYVRRQGEARSEKQAKQREDIVVRDSLKVRRRARSSFDWLKFFETWPKFST